MSRYYKPVFSVKHNSYFVYYSYCHRGDINKSQKWVADTIATIGLISAENLHNPEFMKRLEDLVTQYPPEYYIKRHATYKYESYTDEDISRALSSNEEVNNVSLPMFWGEGIYVQIWKMLGLHDFFTKLSNRKEYQIPKNIDLIVFLLAVYRLVDPESKLATFKILEKSAFNYSGITLHDIYDSLSVCDVFKDNIIKTINTHVDAILPQDPELIFCDATNTWQERYNKTPDPVVDPNEKPKTKAEQLAQARSSEATRNLGSRGLSKENRRNENLVGVMLLMGSRGIPVYIETYRGNKPEQKAMLPVLERYTKLMGISHFTLVADAGLNQGVTLKYIAERDNNYILGYPPKSKLKEKYGKLLRDQSNWKLYKTLKSGEIQYKCIDGIPFKRKVGKEYYYPQARFIGIFSQAEANKKNKEINAKEEKAKLAIERKTVSLNNSYVAYADKNQKKAFVVKDNLIQTQRIWAGYNGILTNITNIEVPKIIEIRSFQWKIEEKFKFFKSILKFHPLRVFTDPHISGNNVIVFITTVMQDVLRLLLEKQGTPLTDTEILEVVRSAYLQATRVLDNKIKYVTLTHNQRRVENNYICIAKLLNLPKCDDMIPAKIFESKVGQFLKLNYSMFDQIPEYTYSDVGRKHKRKYADIIGDLILNTK